MASAEEFLGPPKKQSAEAFLGGPAQPQDSAGGFFERVWKGLTGGDASKAGLFGAGMADPVYGGAQIGARMQATPGMGVPEQALAGPGPDVTKEIDTAVQQRERSISEKSKAAGTDSFWGGQWARMLGNVASTAPLAAVGGAAAPATTAGRLGASALIGGAAGATEPVAGGNFAAEKAKQIGLGGVAGTAGGALGELVSSTLGKALAGNNTAAIDRYLTSGFKQTVRPGRMPGVVGSPQLKMQDNRILTAVDAMTQLAKSGHLSLTDEAGNLLPQGALPRTLRQFSEGLDDAKRLVFQQYDQMAQQTGQQGVQIGLMPFVNQLRQIAADKVTKDTAPAVARDALKLADTYEARLFYTPSEMQDAIKLLGREVTKDVRATGFSPIKPIVDNMRQTLDNTINTLQGPGYQTLKTQYGALRSIEKDVANAAQNEAKKLPWGSSLANFVTAEEVLRGVWHMDPKAIGTAAAIQGAKQYMRWLNNPNRAIVKLFQQRANPPGAFRQGAASALSRSFVPGAIVGEKAQEQVRRGGVRVEDIEISAPAGVR